MQQQNITRRGVLAGTALAALAGANATATRALAGAVDPDEEILSAFRQWVVYQRQLDLAASLPEAEFRALSDRADDAAKLAMSFTPETAMGMAAQVHLSVHMAYGGRHDDGTAAFYPDDGETADLRPMFERVERMTAHLRGSAAA